MAPHRGLAAPGPVAALTALDDPALAGKIDTLRTELRRGTGSARLSPLLEELAGELDLRFRESIAPGATAHSTTLAQEVLTTLADRLLLSPVAEEAKLIRASLTGGEEGVHRAARQLAELLTERIEAAGPSTNKALLRLLEYLSVPAEFAERAKALRCALDEPLSAARLEEVRHEMAELIADMRIGVLREKRELEDFLRQLTENLQTLDANLQATASTQYESFDEGRRLGSAMDAHMQGIEASVQSADALDDLKATLHVHVRTIRNQMEAFRRIEDERAAEIDRTRPDVGLRGEDPHCHRTRGIPPPRG